MAIVSITRDFDDKIVLSRGLTDFLKFIASIMVALGHYAGYAITFTDNPVYRFIVMFAGNVGVALFFILSGYGLMKSELNRHQDLLLFIKKKISQSLSSSCSNIIYMANHIMAQWCWSKSSPEVFICNILGIFGWRPLVCQGNNDLLYPIQSISAISRHI